MLLVLALGGNALGNNPQEQLQIVKNTAHSIVKLVKQGHKVAIVHGNGPQVGMINLSFEEASKCNSKVPTVPFPECGAMSQGYIGYHLQLAIDNELRKENLNHNCSSIITQVLVDSNDEAFKNPTKPIGGFYTEEEKIKLEQEKNYVMKSDAGRGYRRVIASPKPQKIVELPVIDTLLKQNNIVICCGGGGIPVINTNEGYQGVDAVIDKDFAASLLANELNADAFIILTAVNRVMINFNKPNQEELISLNSKKAYQYIDEGHFAPGSMLPKVQACLSFVNKRQDKRAIIAALENVDLALVGENGTEIVY